MLVTFLIFGQKNPEWVIDGGSYEDYLEDY